MSDLRAALGTISSMRRQIASGTQFRGYGPLTLAVTGGMAVAAAALQGVAVPAPAEQPRRYLELWIGTAVLGAGFAGVQVWRRSRRLHHGLSDQMLRQAVEQFLPAVGAGLLLTLILLRFVPGAFWMLPGLWQVLYGLGVFASCRCLPRPMPLAGAWFVLTGLVCLSLGDARALAAWTMGLAYGAGQFLVAAILWLDAEEAGDVF